MASNRRSGAGPTRAVRQFRQVGAGLAGRLTEAAARRGFAEPEVLLRWPEIVGADVAPHCQPSKIAYSRAPSLGATLVVEVAAGRGPEIQASAPRILERINRHYGYRAVARLKIVQAPVAGFSESPAIFRGPEPDAAPPAEARAEAERLTAEIRSAGLRTALARLGARVLARPRPSPPPSTKGGSHA